MASTKIEPISNEIAEQRWPGALAAWPEPQTPAALYTDGELLLADSADEHPWVWCPELPAWDAM